MLKLITLFSGIGSQEQALKNIGVKYDLLGFSEIDKWAIKVYCQLHNEKESNNFGDITKIENLPYCDLLTYSFPCQDLSIAGKQSGIKEGTRSGLLFEVERLLSRMIEKPKYLLLENVKNLISEKFYNSYQDWLNKLSRFGYVNYSMLLNAKDYGIPQNRERVFCVSIRNDIDKFFWTPQKQKLEVFLFNLLEKNIDEKYFIKEKRINWLNEGKGFFGKNYINNSNIARCITTSCDETSSNYVLHQIGYINSNRQGQRIYQDNIAANLSANGGGMGANTGLYFANKRIRKLIPKECFRLMGFGDELFNRIAGISDRQLYKMAGNSIVVNVLESIFKNLFLEI